MRTVARTTGVEATIRALRDKIKETAPAIRDGVQAVCESILRSANKRCPVEKGAMKATGRILVTGSGVGVRGTVQYGGTYAPYTVFVHENLNAVHAAPTEAKWLERAVQRIKSSGAATKLMGRAFKRQILSLENEVEKVIGGDADFATRGDMRAQPGQGGRMRG